MKKIIFILFLLYFPMQIFATGQYGDFLVVDNDTVEITSNPLEQYFKIKGKRTIGKYEMKEDCTALWRGYVAFWKIENDSIFLTNVVYKYCTKPKSLKLKKEFGSSNVFAYWINQNITIPKGKLLSYVHMGYESFYEKEEILTIKSGLLINKETINYVDYSSGELIPDENEIYKIIENQIYNCLTSTKNIKIIEDLNVVLNVSFKPNGKFNNLSFSYGSNPNEEPKNEYEGIIYNCIKNYLENFPKLMEVRHLNYEPPYIQIFISSHCFEFPNDKEYGCFN